MAVWNWGRLKFFRKNVLETQLQLHENCFQLVQGETMFAVFDPEKRLVGDAGFLCKLGVGKIAPLLPEEFCQLLVQISSHATKAVKRFITYA